jgi:hypothetical protein
LLALAGLIDADQNPSTYGPPTLGILASISRSKLSIMSLLQTCPVVIASCLHLT